MSNPILITLSEQINRQYQQAAEHNQKAMDAEEAAGALLMAAKALVPEGEWEQWLQENVGLDKKQALNYIGYVQDEQEQRIIVQHKFGFLKELEGEERERKMKEIDLSYLNR